MWLPRQTGKQLEHIKERVDNDSELYDLDRGLTPLHCASKRGHSSAILLLAAAGADKAAQVFLSFCFLFSLLLSIILLLANRDSL